jgi:hypothetical protein
MTDEGIPFSRSVPPQAVLPCQTPCAVGKRNDDDLSKGTQKLIKEITGQSVQATGMAPGDGGPMMYSADSSPCQRQAYQLGPTLRRFNRYREALPYAYAANDMAEAKKKREPGKPLKAPQPSAKSCMQRLSSDPDELCKQLGLKEGAISEKDLRDDDTGFLAAVYRDQATGKAILVTNDTDPNSLVDWKTNLENGDGRETDQYKAARKLAKKLMKNGVKYDIAGYSKGGGMAQLMGLVNNEANVVVFNSAGLPENFASAEELASLTTRTKSYSAEGDLLTYMNETRDPAKLVENAEFLKKELMGEGAGVNPMKVTYRNPEKPKGKNDPAFADARKEMVALMDRQIEAVKKDGKPPPPVRAAHKEVVKDSDYWYAAGSTDDKPSLGKQTQHLMSHVLDPMKTNVDKDREALYGFLERCG